MPTTPKGQATRRRILDAAWELSDARGAEAILAGVTLRELAAAVDMAPSAISYHFPTTRDLAIAMVERLAESISMAPVDAIDPVLDHLEPAGMAAAVRSGAEANWAVVIDPFELAVQRRIDRCYTALGDADADVLRSRLSPMVDSWVQALAALYRATLDQMGLGLVAPFTAEEMARAVSSMVEGMVHHWMCHPDTIRPDLVPDLVVALVTATVVPAPAQVTLDELATRLPNPSASSDPHPATAAIAAAPLFSDGIAGVTLTEVAGVMGCHPDDVVAQYGTVEGVAAASFARHLPAVIAATERRRQHDPSVSFTDGVYELTRCAQRDRHCAFALLVHRQRAAMETGSPIPSVALDPVLADPIDRLLGLGGPASTDHASTVVDYVLSRAAIKPRTPIASIAETALRLLPTG
jgi:AcrR family transcriptional regulator